MKKYSIIYLLLLTVGVYFFAVPEYKLNRVLTENKRLKLQIDELKFGEERLVAMVVTSYKDKKYSVAKHNIDLLSLKYPESKKNEEFKKILVDINKKRDEIAIFNEVKRKEKFEKAKGIFTGTDICRGVIATIMSKPLAIVNETSVKDNIHLLNYTRDDGTNWVYKCKLYNNNALWGTMSVKNKIVIEGRWRNSPEDPVIKFHTNDKILIITETYSDNSKTQKIFNKSDF